MPVAKQIGGMPRQFVISESLITQFLKYQECTKVWKGMKDVVLFFFYRRITAWVMNPVLYECEKHKHW